MDLTIRRSRLNPWLGYLDAMIALLLVVLLTIVVAYLRDGERIERLWVEARQRSVFAALEATFPTEITRGTIRVRSDGNLQRLSFSDGLLFVEGSRQLRGEGREVLDRLRTVLEQELASNPHAFQRIEIEAHADPRAPRRTLEFRDNWQLSAARAAEVVTYFVGDERAARARKAAGRETPLDPALFSASGFSIFRPPSGALEELGSTYFAGTRQAASPSALAPVDLDQRLAHFYDLARRMDVLLTYSMELPR